MISHQYKCIFVEVPKTGSTSVRRILGRAIKPHMSLSEIRRMMESYWVIRGRRKDRILEWLYPMLPAEWRKERGRRQFESYFKFGFTLTGWQWVGVALTTLVVALLPARPVEEIEYVPAPAPA